MIVIHRYILNMGCDPSPLHIMVCRLIKQSVITTVQNEAIVAKKALHLKGG